MTCECCDYQEVNIGYYQCVNDDCDPVGAVVIDVFDYGEIVFPEGMSFDQRAKMLPPPRAGYVMFADSAPDTNVPHLLAQEFHRRRSVSQQWARLMLFGTLSQTMERIHNEKYFHSPRRVWYSVL